MAQIDIPGFSGMQITEETKNLEYRQCIAALRVNSIGPRVSTSSYSGEIQALYYCFDVARMRKALLSELLFCNIGVRGYRPMFETITQMRRIE